MNSAHIAPFTVPTTRRFARHLRPARRVLLPIFLGSCALPALSAQAQTSANSAATPRAAPRASAAQTPPIRATMPRASAAQTPPIVLPVASATGAVASPASIALSASGELPPLPPPPPLRQEEQNLAQTPKSAPKSLAHSAVKSAAKTQPTKVTVVANAQMTPPLALNNSLNTPINTSVRIAQLAPSDTEAPATPPETGPEGLKVPVGPDIPNNGTPAPAPPETGDPAAPPRVAPPNGAPVLDNSPDQPSIIGDVSAAEGREISDVRVVGSRVVPADTILAQVKLQRGAAFSSRQAQLDLARINQLGFFAATQAQIAPDLNDPTKFVLTYIVVENRVITGFDFVNNTAVKPADILPILTSKVGTVLNRNSVSADVAAIQKLYQDKGFAVVVKSAQQTEDGKLVFDFSEAVISAVNIIGLKKTRESLVRSQIRIKPGDTFDAAKMRQDLNRLYDTNFFDSVDPRVDDDPNKAGAVIVNFVFREKRTGQFQVGVGFDSRSKLSGFVTLSESNLRGTGQRGFASIEAGSQRNFEVGTGNPFIGPKNASYDVSIYRRSIFREPRLLKNVGVSTSSDFSYEEQRTGGRINFTKPLDYDRRRTLIFGYRNERAELRQTNREGQSEPVTGAGKDLSSAGTISAPSIGFLHDSRDLRIDPSSGGRESIVLEQAFKLLGGSTNFTKLDLDLRRYVPLIKGEKIGTPAKLVLAGRVVLGRSVNQLPAFEQYYIGGTDTVRGYNVDQQFGDNQIYGNAELRYRFQSRITGVLFADSGTAYGGRFSSGKNLDFLSSVGVGVRLVTPIGPVRLDYGVGRDGGRTHFGIGSTF